MDLTTLWVVSLETTIYCGSGNSMDTNFVECATCWPIYALNWYFISSLYRRQNDSKLVENLNSSLAFFLHDLLSVMDRGFVFSLIRTYSKEITAKATSAVDSVVLWNLQLNFTRIVCSHEHYVALNLPSSNPAAASVTFDLYSGASSPTPSVRSNDSQSSFISHLTEKTHWAELTPEFKRRHFLVGLVLSQLSSAFENS